MKLRGLLGPLAIVSLFLGVWYAVAYGIENNFSPISGKALVIPPPHRMFEGVNSSVRHDVLIATRVTFVTSISGLLLSVALAWTLAIFMSAFRSFERSIWPFLVALQAIPIVALVPLIIQVIGINSRSRVLVVILITFFPLVSNAVDGLNRVSTAELNLFHLYGSSRRDQFLKLRIPNAVPSAFNGLRVAAGLSVVGAIVADFFFARGDLGLGRAITEYFQSTQPGPMIFASICAAFLGLFMFSISHLLQVRMNTRWSPQTTSQNSPGLA